MPPSLAGGEKHSTRPESQRHRRPGQEARVTASSDAILLPLRWPPPPLHWQVPWAPPLGLSTVTPLVPIGSIFYRSPHWPSCIQSCPTPTHPPEATESQSDPLKIYIRSHRLSAPVAACVWQGDSQDDLQCPPPDGILYGEWNGSNVIDAISAISLPNTVTSICHQTLSLSLSLSPP